MFVTLRSHLNRNFPNQSLNFYFVSLWPQVFISFKILNTYMLMTLILFHLLLYHFSSIFTLEKFYLIITSSILWILCFWLQFKMIEVMKYAKYMQIYAFQSSFIGLSFIHMYIVTCISKLVSYFFYSSNWRRHKLNLLYTVHLCCWSFFLGF